MVSKCVKIVDLKTFKAIEVSLKLMFTVETAVMDEVISTFLAEEGMHKLLGNSAVKSCSQ